MSSSSVGKSDMSWCGVVGCEGGRLLWKPPGDRIPLWDEVEEEGAKEGSRRRFCCLNVQPRVGGISQARNIFSE